MGSTLFDYSLNQNGFPFPRPWFFPFLMCLFKFYTTKLFFSYSLLEESLYGVPLLTALIITACVTCALLLNYKPTEDQTPGSHSPFACVPSAAPDTYLFCSVD